MIVASYIYLPYITRESIMIPLSILMLFDQQCAFRAYAFPRVYVWKYVMLKVYNMFLHFVNISLFPLVFGTHIIIFLLVPTKENFPHSLLATDRKALVIYA